MTNIRRISRVGLFLEYESADINFNVASELFRKFLIKACPYFAQEYKDLFSIYKVFK